MDPATLNAFVQLASYGISVLDRVRAGEITDAEAQQILNGSYEHLQAAIGRFNNAVVKRTSPQT